MRNAAKAGWEVVAEKGTTIISRGDERIEIEIGSAGIPRKVTRTHLDGSVETMSQNYIRMTDVLSWLPKRDEHE